MSRKLTSKESELFRRIDEVLYYLWDPIGVSTNPNARNEYDSYSLAIFSLLAQNKTQNDIIQYLLKAEKEIMDLPSTKTNETNVAEVANVLLEYRKLIRNK
jgi:hypothetical protein